MNSDRLRLSLSFAGSIAVNTLIIAPAAVVVFTADPPVASGDDASHQSELDTPSIDDIELGIDESDASTLTWVGYEDYLEHVARQAEFEQAQLQAAKGERASGEPEAAPAPEPVPPTQTTPAEAQPAQPPPAQPRPVEPEAVEPPAAAQPETEAPPETVGLPIDPQSQTPGLPADIPGVPEPRPSTSETEESAPGEAPDLNPEVRPPDSSPSETRPPESEPPPTETPTEPQTAPAEPAPAQPPAAPATTPADSPSQTTSEPDPSAPKGVKGVDDAPIRLDGSDRDADATSLVQVSRRNLNLGRPLAREGIKLYPRKPDFTSLQVASSSGKRGVLARLVFKSTGRIRNGRMLPRKAYIGHEITSGPDKGTVRWFNDSLRFDRLEQSIHTSLFSWSATGRRIDEIEEGTPVIINLELQVAIR